MAVKITAIVPKEWPTSKLSSDAQMRRLLATFASEALSMFQEYPAAQPWRSRPPKTGPRAGGRRTGTYGRSWTMRSSGTEAVVENKVPYAKYVGGRTGEQTRNMAQRGWPSASKVAPEALRRAKGKAR